jgi:hypothetical protein
MQHADVLVSLGARDERVCLPPHEATPDFQRQYSPYSAVIRRSPLGRPPRYSSPFLLAIAGRLLNVRLCLKTMGPVRLRPNKIDGCRFYQHSFLLFPVLLYTSVAFYSDEQALQQTVPALWLCSLLGEITPGIIRRGAGLERGHHRLSLRSQLALQLFDAARQTAEKAKARY